MRQITAIPTSNPCPACHIEQSVIEQVMDFHPDAAKHYSIYMVTCHNPACDHKTTTSIGRRNHSDNACFETDKD